MIHSPLIESSTGDQKTPPPLGESWTGQVGRLSRHIVGEQARQDPGVARNVTCNRRVYRGMIVYLFGRFGPFKRQMDNFARGLNGFQRAQGGLQHGHLPGGVTGLPEGAPQRVLDGGDARHTDRGGQVGHGGQGDGREAGGFEFALYQSYGPAADRSGRHQHDHVRQVSFQIPDERRDGLAQELFRVEDIAHR